MQGLVHQAILGDLNTMGHGIARLSPSFCCDQMRFRSLGLTEAEFWERNVISQPDPRFQPDRDGNPVGVAGAESSAVVTNDRLRKFGVPEDVCRDALNPGRRGHFVTFHILSILGSKAFQWVLQNEPCVYRNKVARRQQNLLHMRCLLSQATFRFVAPLGRLLVGM